MDVGDLDALKTAKAALPDLSYVFDAITLTRKRLEGKVPLLGFTGAPVSFSLVDYKFGTYYSNFSD